MTISKRVQQELQQVAPDAGADLMDVDDVAHYTTREARARREALAAKNKGQAWTQDEHARFLDALARYPSGPWEAIAEYVGTKNARQTMTHAQKCRQKNERRARGLRSTVRRRKNKLRVDVGTASSPSGADANVTLDSVSPSTGSTPTTPSTGSTPTSPSPVSTTPTPSTPTKQRMDEVTQELKSYFATKMPTSESPRSGEDECVKPDPSLPLEDALVREIFAQFPTPPSLQSAWSTSSFPDVPMDLSDFDDGLAFSATLPDEFSLLQWAV